MATSEIQAAALKTIDDCLGIDMGRIDGEIETPQDINHGYCLGFAEILTVRVDADVRILCCYDSMWAHCWVEYDGLHYDAETPGGIEDWRDFPFYTRHPRTQDDEPVELEIDEEIEAWLIEEYR